MGIKGVAYTHVGKIRTNNEDNFYLFGEYKEETTENEKFISKNLEGDKGLISVCDGMGGASYGELASLYAVKQLNPCDISNVKEESLKQINTANELICDEIRKQNGARIGTTIASLYIDKNKAVACNIGDSRCYILREDKFKQLSKDHSEGQKMIDDGILSEQEARKHKSWHVLSQHLGIFSEEFLIEPYYSKEISVKPKDRFLLCSDGLTDLLMDEDIYSIMKQDKEIEEIAKDLVNAALEKGGKDNVTVVVIEADGEEYGVADTTNDKDNDEDEDSLKKKLINPFSIVLLIIILFLLIALLVCSVQRDHYKKDSKMHEDQIGILFKEINNLKENVADYEEQLVEQKNILLEEQNSHNELQKKYDSMNEEYTELKDNVETILENNLPGYKKKANKGSEEE